MTIKLRDYQQEAVDIALQMDSGARGLFALPTGTGKAIILSAIASNTKGRSLIVVPSSELREQAIEKMRMVDPTLDIGSVQAKLNDVHTKVVVATRQSLTHAKSDRMERIMDNGEFDVVIIDEVHGACGQIEKIIKKVNKDAKVLGFTATPFNPELSKIFNGIAYNKDLFDMITDGYLTEPKAIQIMTKTNLSNVSRTAGDFNQKELENTVNTSERNQMIVEAYKMYAANRRHTIVFATGIEHCRAIENEFNRQGVNCKSVDSNLDMDNRSEIIEGFKQGKFKVLVNVGILTTGFDMPELDTIMMARPTQSKTLYLQILGRGLRLAKDKTECLIIDLVDTVKNHNIMDMSSVFDFPIKHEETVKQAFERSKQEKVQMETLKQQREEEKRIQIELMAKEIMLFNKDMKKAFQVAYYDWTLVQLNTYSLSQSSDIHYVIDCIGENEFALYKANTNKDNRTIEVLDGNTNLKELIEQVENECIKYPTSFTVRDSSWKKEKATPNQIKCLPWVRTKWEASCYFNNQYIKKLLKTI